jgi:thiosulfate/3-mercaptopyruvate sulfurtransferase
MLLPARMLAAQFSLLGLAPSDTVVLVAGDKFHDATLAAIALERVGHARVAVLDGGYAGWVAVGRPVDTALPAVAPSTYPVPEGPDRFTADHRAVASALGKPGTVIIDVRPSDFFTGKKSDEARAGHIPGAISRPYTEDIVTSTRGVVAFKPVDVLRAEYARIVPSKDADIIVHCRTGHQASQAYFVLKHLLGYPRVRWYDGGWTEWAARSELPIVNEGLAAPGR